MIGKKLSPILSEIESALIEFEINVARPPEYTDEGFRASVKIFLSVMLDKMWKLQEDEGILQIASTGTSTMIIGWGSDATGPGDTASLSFNSSGAQIIT
jgi:hypothetical protein